MPNKIKFKIQKSIIIKLFRSFIEMKILLKNLINFENYLVWEMILDTLSRSHHTIYDTRLGLGYKLEILEL